MSLQRFKKKNSEKIYLILENWIKIIFILQVHSAPHQFLSALKVGKKEESGLTLFCQEEARMDSEWSGPRGRFPRVVHFHFFTEREDSRPLLVPATTFGIKGVSPQGSEVNS